MTKFLFACWFVMNALKAASQTCVHADLSKSLLFKTQPPRLKRKDGYDSCRVRITVVSKLRHQTVFTTTLASSFLFNSAYAHCDAARSYTTQAGQNIDTKDYDYGDLVVADFNFDGKEDFAAKNDSGGNGGPTYNFYFQNSASSFVLDKFLTERMGHFPDKIDKPAKTLVLESDNGLWYFKTSYRFDTKSGKWHEIKKSGTHKKR
jgi:hypothetical protein